MVSSCGEYTAIFVPCRHKTLDTLVSCCASSANTMNYQSEPRKMLIGNSCRGSENDKCDSFVRAVNQNKLISRNIEDSKRSFVLYYEI